MEKSYHQALSGKDPAKIEQTKIGEANAVMVTYEHQASSFYDEDKDEDRNRNRNGNHPPKHPEDLTQSPPDGLGEKPKSMIQQPSAVATTSTTSPQSLVPQNEVGILVGVADQTSIFTDMCYTYHSGLVDRVDKNGNKIMKTITTCDKSGNLVEKTEVAQVRVITTKKQLGAAAGKAVVAAGASVLGNSFKWVVQGALKTAFIEIYAVPLVNSVVDLIFSEVPAIITQHTITEPLNILIDLVNTDQDWVNLLARFGYSEDTIAYNENLNKSKHHLWKLAMFFGFTKNPILNFFDCEYQVVGRIIGNIVHDIFVTVFNRFNNFVIFKNCSKALAKFGFEAMRIIFQKIQKNYTSKEKFLADLKKCYDDNLKPCLPKNLGDAYHIYQHISNTYTDLANTLEAFKIALHSNTSSSNRSMIEDIVGLAAEQENALRAQKRKSLEAKRKIGRLKSRMMGPQPQGDDDSLTPEEFQLAAAQTALLNCNVGKLLQDQDELSSEKKKIIQFFPEVKGTQVISTEDAFQEMNILEGEGSITRPSYESAPETFDVFMDKGFQLPPKKEREGADYEGNDRLKNYSTDLDLLSEAAYNNLQSYAPINYITPLGGDASTQVKGLQNKDAWNLMIEEYAGWIFDVPEKGRDLDDIFKLKDPKNQSPIMKAAVLTYARFREAQKRRGAIDDVLQQQKKGKLLWLTYDLNVRKRIPLGFS